MTTQTTYSASHEKAYVGQIGTLVPSTVISKQVEDVAGIGFGKVVVRGTAEREVAAPSAIGKTNYVGITVRDQSARHVTSTDTDKFLKGDEAAIITKGDVWVSVSANVTAGNDVYYNEANGNITGAAATNYTQIKNAKFETTAQSGDLAMVRMG